jgi:hypothetical protein
MIKRISIGVAYNVNMTMEIPFRLFVIKTTNPTVNYANELKSELPYSILKYPASGSLNPE